MAFLYASSNYFKNILESRFHPPNQSSMQDTNTTPMVKGKKDLHKENEVTLPGIKSQACHAHECAPRATATPLICHIINRAIRGWPEFRQEHQSILGVFHINSVKIRLVSRKGIIVLSLYYNPAFLKSQGPHWWVEQQDKFKCRNRGRGWGSPTQCHCVPGHSPIEVSDMC